MKRNQFCASAVVFACVLLLSCLPSLQAQQAPEGRKWVVLDPKRVELTSSGIHFFPADAKMGSSSITTAIHLPTGKPWKVAFDVQMGPTLLNAMSIHLLQGKTDVAWLGADSYYKSMSAFVGSGNANMPYSQPWDTNWHSFAYISDGKTLSLWHNGVKCGEGASTGTPDTLEVGSTQLELKIRNVHVVNLALLPLSSAATPLGNRPSMTPDSVAKAFPTNESVVDNSDATLYQTRQWICNTLNKLAGTFFQDGINGQSYSEAHFDGNDLIYSGKEDQSEFHSSLVFYETRKIPLEVADENKVVVSKVDAAFAGDNVSYKVTVSSLGNASLFSNSFRMYSDSEPNAPAKYESGTSFSIWFGDKNMAERFAKAIRHAIRLCKANPIKEPF